MYKLIIIGILFLVFNSSSFSKPKKINKSINKVQTNSVENRIIEFSNLQQKQLIKLAVPKQKFEFLILKRYLYINSLCIENDSFSLIQNNFPFNNIFELITYQVNGVGVSNINYFDK